jgi:hypothetical protein
VSRRLIERRRSSEDRRRHLVELTTAGANRLAQAESALATIEDEVLGHLDAEQRETLCRASGTRSETTAASSPPSGTSTIPTTTSRPTCGSSRRFQSELHVTTRREGR